MECKALATRKTAAFLCILLAIAAAIKGQEVLTNDSIIKMVKAGLPDSVIVQMIQSQPGKYSLTSDSLIKLKQQGVPGNVLSAMLAKRSGEPPRDRESTLGIWQVNDVTDRMTGEHAFEAVMTEPAIGNRKEGEFRITATCNAETLSFKIVYLSSSDPKLGFKQNEVTNAIRGYKPWLQMRVRIDEGDAETVSSESDFLNEATLFFAGHSFAQARSDILSGSGKSETSEGKKGEELGAALNAALHNSPGSMQDALSAHSILVELPLANSDNPIIEIKPQDPSFRKFVSKCSTTFSEGLSDSEHTRSAEASNAAKSEPRHQPYSAPESTSPKTTQGGMGSGLAAAIRAHEAGMPPRPRYTGTADEFAAAFPVFLQRAALAIGRDSKDYDKETAFIISFVRTCAQITPKMALSVTNQYGQVILRKLGDQYTGCFTGASASDRVKTWNKNLERGIMLQLDPLGDWRDGQGFTANVFFYGMNSNAYPIVWAMIKLK